MRFMSFIRLTRQMKGSFSLLAVPLSCRMYLRKVDTLTVKVLGKIEGESTLPRPNLTAI